MLLIVQLIAELLPCVAARSSHITWVVKNNYENVLHEREMEAERERGRGREFISPCIFLLRWFFHFLILRKTVQGYRFQQNLDLRQELWWVDNSTSTNFQDMEILITGIYLYHRSKPARRWFISRNGRTLRKNTFLFTDLLIINQITKLEITSQVGRLNGG